MICDTTMRVQGSKNALWLVACFAAILLCDNGVAEGACPLSLSTICDASPPGTTFLIYDGATGELKLEAGDRLVTTIEIKSEAGLFSGTPATGLIQPPFDVFKPDKLFLLRSDGISYQSFGDVLPPALSQDQLRSDFAVEGSFRPNGPLGAVTILAYNSVPEPTGGALVSIGAVLSILGMRTNSQRVAGSK